MTKIIGFGHKARHGKDSLAALVANQLGGSARIYTLGAALKAFARVLGMQKKNAPLLQALGTEVMRAIDPNIWIRILAETIEEDAPPIALVSDVRFPGEANWIKLVGGKVIGVYRLNQDGSPYVAPDRPANHPSETALDGYQFDLTVTAETGAMNLLRRAAREVCDLAGC